MTSADLQELVGQKPFVPLRLFVSDGTVHEIYYSPATGIS